MTCRIFNHNLCTIYSSEDLFSHINFSSIGASATEEDTHASSPTRQGLCDGDCYETQTRLSSRIIDAVHRTQPSLLPFILLARLLLTQNYCLRRDHLLASHIAKYQPPVRILAVYSLLPCRDPEFAQTLESTR